MRFGRGNLRGGNPIVETLIFPYFFEVTSLRRGGNPIVETLIFPYFLRLPHSEEVVTSLSRRGNPHGSYAEA